ncbi:hypothetical protein [Actinocorallia sp. A-T 12471]|uniref:hypothetical protein n=1 Tax=Actinocorallia sp. A-T 12471 TaxID=3089813 RepID=UPI0029D30606|nr:hypothetical protein [Actinocorallia sp. A-T 12471]MDX6743506.1 hypothetical protein [Actinocorallia sp. A-T 12471]
MGRFWRVGAFPVGAAAAVTLAAAVAAIAAGCGTKTAAPASAAKPVAALLTADDLPTGYQPAAAHEVFRGITPVDADCAALLALADGRGLRASAPASVAVFYQASPGGTVAQRVVRLGDRGAAKAVGEARRLIGGCPAIEAPAGEGVLALERVHLETPRLNAADTVAAAYRQRTADGVRLSYEIVAHRVGGELLLVAGPVLLADGQAGPVAGAAEAAAAKLEQATKVSP